MFDKATFWIGNMITHYWQ